MKNENFSLLLTIFKPASLFLSLILHTLCSVFLPSSAIGVILIYLSFFYLKNLASFLKKEKIFKVTLEVFSPNFFVKE
jgi:hypothetical protein